MSVSRLAFSLLVQSSCSGELGGEPPTDPAHPQLSYLEACGWASLQVCLQNGLCASQKQSALLCLQQLGHGGWRAAKQVLLCPNPREGHCASERASHLPWVTEPQGQMLGLEPARSHSRPCVPVRHDWSSQGGLDCKLSFSVP